MPPSASLAALALLALGLVACGRVHVGTDDGGAGTDAGPAADAGGAPDAGSPDAGSPETCGPITCGAGEECCNASCGICTPPGLACTTLACERTCATDADCLGTDYCAHSGSCGGVDGVCIPRADECGAGIDPVCGCDGETYTNSCEASRAGVSVASQGACAVDCSAQDINSGGPCPAFFGIYWDGATCVEAGGCGCTGADCEDIYELSEAGRERCFAEHSGCIDCGAMDAAGVGECLAELGVAWDGSTCVPISGCDCAGSDCSQVYSSTQACEAAHAHCAAGCAADSDCAPGGGEYCRFEQGVCPGDGASGTCEPITGPTPFCTFDAPPVCGCDGRNYGCPDDAHGQGQNVRSLGLCPGSGGPCDAFDASGDGACFLDFGMKWNGSSCEAVGGCECVGSDCSRLYPSQESCESAHAGCERVPGGTCGGIAGELCRPDEFCDFPGASTLCGGDDDQGTCTSRPEGCFGAVDPVCACDNTVYTNECEANAAGWDVRDPDPNACPDP